MRDLLDQLSGLDGPVDPGSRFREQLWDAVDAELRATERQAAPTPRPVPLRSTPERQQRPRPPSWGAAGLAWVRASRLRTVSVAAGLIALIVVGAGTLVFGGVDPDGDQSVEVVDGGPTASPSSLDPDLPTSAPLRSSPPSDGGPGGAPRPAGPGSETGMDPTTTFAPGGPPGLSPDPVPPPSRWLVLYAASTADASFEVFTTPAGSRDAPERLFSRPGFDGHPALSPDRQRLAWTAGNDSDTEPRTVWVADAKGNGARRLPLAQCAVYFQCDYSWPSFSPDGRRLAMTRNTGNSQCTPAQRCDEVVVFDMASAALEAVGYGREPDWSQTRAEIVYAGSEGPTPRSACEVNLCGDVEIRVVDVSSPRRVSRSLDVFGSMPRFSPDGEWIAFQQTSSPAGGAVMRRDGSDLRPLPGCIQPNWTPDGRLACVMSVDGGRDVFLLDADDSPAARLTYTTGLETQFRLYAL